LSAPSDIQLAIKSGFKVRRPEKAVAGVVIWVRVIHNPFAAPVEVYRIGKQVSLRRKRQEVGIDGNSVYHD